MTALTTVVRLALIVIAIRAGSDWLRITLRASTAQSKRLAHVPAPDATPFDQLPTADQRVAAIDAWAALQAERISTLWDMQVARLSLLVAALAALTVLGWALPGWWGVIAVVPLVLMYRVYRLIRQVKDERTGALEVVEARRKELAQIILEPR